jgi:DNA-binding PadR family transcriptional regulator
MGVFSLPSTAIFLSGRSTAIGAGRCGHRQEDDTDPRIARAIIGAIREQDRSGYEIWRWLGTTHGSHGVELSEANLYPTLHRLEAERLIAGYWEEGDRIRRVYRVASRGSTAASQGGWQAIRRPLRADPEAVAVAADEGPRFRGEELEQAGSRVIADFVNSLDRALRLSNPHRSDVRNEIRDHLEDSSAERARTGLDPDRAARASVEALGSPEELAGAIDTAEMTRGRLALGMGSAAVSALFGIALGVAGAGTAVLLLPVVGRWVVSWLASVGLHLYLPDTIAWRSEQFAVVAAIAAFLGARRSTPQLARTSRRAESSIRLPWAIAGGVVLALIALLAPVKLDRLTAITLVAMPVAFALGTVRAQGQDDDLVSRRGIIQASALVLVLIFLPGVRLWYFAPSSVPAGAPPAASASGQIVWAPGPTNSLPFIDVQGLDPQWKDPELQFWPATGQGLTLAPDPSATTPTFTLKPTTQVPFDNNLVRSTADWWVVLTAVGPDGTRHSLTADAHMGYDSPQEQNLLGWLLGPK